MFAFTEHGLEKINQNKLASSYSSSPLIKLNDQSNNEHLQSIYMNCSDKQCRSKSQLETIEKKGREYSKNRWNNRSTQMRAQATNQVAEKDLLEAT